MVTLKLQRSLYCSDFKVPALMANIAKNFMMNFIYICHVVLKSQDDFHLMIYNIKSPVIT